MNRQNRSMNRTRLALVLAMLGACGLVAAPFIMTASASPESMTHDSHAMSAPLWGMVSVPAKQRPAQTGAFIRKLADGSWASATEADATHIATGKLGQPATGVREYVRQAPAPAQESPIMLGLPVPAAPIMADQAQAAVVASVSKAGKRAPLPVVRGATILPHRTEADRFAPDKAAAALPEGTLCIIPSEDGASFTLALRSANPRYPLAKSIPVARWATISADVTAALQRQG